MLWTLIMIFSVLLFVLGIVYMCKSISKFGIKNKFIPYLFVIILTLVLTLILNFITAVIIIIHYLIVWLFMDLIFLLFKKVSKKELKHYYAGIITLILVPIYIGVGIYNVYNIEETKYNFKSQKLSNKYKIALISDSHMGTTFNADKFYEYLKEIEKNNPDIILIAGDFVDDGTTKEEMIKSCEYLGKIKTKYGIYFAHGNHDKGYYGEKRGYSSLDLESELSKNNVKVLKDDYTLINDELYIIGRKDFEDLNRLNMSDLMEDLDKNKYMLVIDHQPTDYTNEANSDVDLVVSGHTHGGQLIPLNLINTLVSENDAVYGHKRIKNTNFIVTSGISDWEIKMKTGCMSEYVLININ